MTLDITFGPHCPNCGKRHVVEWGTAERCTVRKPRPPSKYKPSPVTTEYNTIHVWNLRHWSKTGTCEFCGEKRKTMWSNISGEYRKGDKTDWQELCARCHWYYDHEVLAAVKLRITHVKKRILLTELTPAGTAGAG